MSGSRHSSHAERVVAGMTDAEQQAVFDLMRERLLQLFGPGGSFRVTLGRGSEAEALFTSTVADTIAWDVAEQLGAHPVSARRAAVVEEPEQTILWTHVEHEVLRRRQSEAALEVAVTSSAVHAA